MGNANLKRAGMTRAQNFRRRMRLVAKLAVQHLRFPARPDKKTLFIFGCQRSGTTVMLRIFERDARTRVFGEVSALSSRDTVDRLRLNPLPEVRSALDATRCGFVVVKPLVESQRAHEILSFFPSSYGLWMFRHYRDVAASNLARFGVGNGIRNLRPLVAGDPANWRSEAVPDDLRDLVRGFFSDSMNPLDAAALFWYVRNELLRRQNLGDRVLLCRYEELVTQPQAELRRIYAHLAEDTPGDRVLAEVESSAIGKGRRGELDPRIESLCEGLLETLDARCWAQRENGTLPTAE